MFENACKEIASRFYARHPYIGGSYRLLKRVQGTWVVVGTFNTLAHANSCLDEEAEYKIEFRLPDELVEKPVNVSLPPRQNLFVKKVVNNSIIQKIKTRRK